MTHEDPAGQDPTNHQHNPSGVSYTELEAQAAAMREALQEVWAVCSHEHWPKVGNALESSAGQELLERLGRAEYHRDLLRPALRPFAEAAFDHDEHVATAAMYSCLVPDEDEDPAEIEITVGELRTAREALQAVEATDERVEAMRDALERIKAYQDWGPIRSSSDALDLIKGTITLTANQAIGHRHQLVPAHGIDYTEQLVTAQHYEGALREIISQADFVNEHNEPAELYHTALVDIPETAREALEPDNDLFDEIGLPEPDANDPDWIPF